MLLRCAQHVLLVCAAVATLMARPSSSEEAHVFESLAAQALLTPDHLSQLDSILAELAGKADDGAPSTNCMLRLISLLQKSNREELVNYIDAAGKPGAGITLGNINMMGSYQQCSQIISNGRYCSASLVVDVEKLHVPLLTTVDSVWGFCSPSECNQNDLAFILGYVVKAKNLTQYVHLNGDSSQSIYCDAGKDTRSAGFIITVCICTLFIVMALVGTLVDGWFMYQKLNITVQYQVMSDAPSSSENVRVPHSDIDIRQDQPTEETTPSMLLTGASNEGSLLLRVFRCLSMTRNAKMILATDVPKGAITSINGVRLFSMWWVILGHTYAFSDKFGDNLRIEQNIIRRFTFLAVLNGVFSVDSFFFLSGLLVAYLTLKRVQSKGGMPWFHFYIHRYLRLTPSYALVILCFIYIVPLIPEGPTEPMLTSAVDGCKKLWWTNLLYINNFYKMDFTGCVAWTWYLANDMQFFVISPIIILLMARLKWIGVVFGNGVLLVASFIVTGVLINHYDLVIDGNGHRAELPRPRNSGEIIYDKPYCRIAPYLVGLALGYVLHKKWQFPQRYRTAAMILGWISAVVVGLSVVYGVWDDYRIGGQPMSDAGNLIYGTFSRFAWACALAWLVFACHSGHGGLLNSFLSWRGFIPLSRLTYGAYLLHPIIIYCYILSEQKPFHYTDMKIIFMFASFVMVSYGSAFVLALLVEYPLMNLEQIVLKRKKD